MFMHVRMSVCTRVCSCPCTCAHGDARGSCQVSCSTILPFFTQTDLSLVSELDNVAAPAIQLTPVIFCLCLPKAGTAGHCPAGFLCGFWGSEPWSSGLHRQHFIHRALLSSLLCTFSSTLPQERTVHGGWQLFGLPDVSVFSWKSKAALAPHKF